MAGSSKSGGGKRYEDPPPKTSAPVRREAGQGMHSKNKTTRSLAASVNRHIEPRRPPKK